MQTVEALIKRHEGLRLKPYVDTVGKTSIGWGRNLTDRGISQAEAEVLFTRDLEEHWEWLHTALPWTASLDPVRHAVLVDMAFNMRGKLLQFTRTLKSIKEGRYDDAAREMLESLWARQVKTRATRLSQMMRSGEWPTS